MSLLSGVMYADKPGDTIPFFHWNFFHLLVWFGALHFPDAHSIDLGSVIDGLFSSNVTVVASNNREGWGVESVCCGSGGDGKDGAAGRGWGVAVGAHLHPLLRRCPTPHCPPACSPECPQTPWSKSSRPCQRHLPWAAQSRCAAISRWWHVHCVPHTSWTSHAGPVKPETDNYPMLESHYSCLCTISSMLFSRVAPTGHKWNSLFMQHFFYISLERKLHEDRDYISFLPLKHYLAHRRCSINTMWGNEWNVRLQNLFLEAKGSLKSLFPFLSNIEYAFSAGL